MKHYRSREKKINGNAKSFTKAEFQFIDVRLFKRNEAPKETMSSTSTSTSKSGTKIILQVPKEDIPTHPLKEESEQGDTSFSVEQADKKVATFTGSSPIVLRYIPKSGGKDGESPFSECTIPKDTTKAASNSKSLVFDML